MIIKNAKVYSDGCRFVEKDLIIRQRPYRGFGARPRRAKIIDVGGAYALPGLVDIHFHGAVGHDFCDADEAGLQAIADFEASKRAFRYLPRHDDFQRGDPERHHGRPPPTRTTTVQIWWASTWKAPTSARRRSVPRTRSTSWAQTLRCSAVCRSAAAGWIKLVDREAPEEPGNLDFIKECRDEVRISIAHTCTSYDTGQGRVCRRCHPHDPPVQRDAGITPP